MAVFAVSASFIISLSFAVCDIPFKLTKNKDATIIDFKIFIIVFVLD
jgi:hypothetical protein